MIADLSTNLLQAAQGESMTIDQKVYSPGDFVYYDVPDSKRNFNLLSINDMLFNLLFLIFIVPGVIYIERLWTNPEGVKMMYGTVFVRPFETYHVCSRKFLEQVNRFSQIFDFTINNVNLYL